MSVVDSPVEPNHRADTELRNRKNIWTYDSA
jgi:hypothetical protein